MKIDLNADLGESYGPWKMGDDDAILQIVTSANIACGGHASDPDTMVETLLLAKARGVVVGAHPGYADPLGFGRRVIPMTPLQIERMVATQIGALMGAAALAGVSVGYVKAHGALANLAADNREVADAIARASRAVSPELALLAISGTELQAAGEEIGIMTYAEIFADRAYLANGRLVPRSRPDAMIASADMAADRVIQMLQTGLMPVVDGDPVRLAAQSICVHGDSAGAVAMAATIKDRLAAANVTLAPFLRAK